MTARVLTTGMLLSTILLCTPAAADVVTITLDDVPIPANTCQTAWMEGSCRVMMVEIGDSETCSWTAEAGGIALMRTGININVAAFEGAELVEIDLIERDGDDLAGAYLFRPGGTSPPFESADSHYSGSDTEQTLSLSAMDDDLAVILIRGGNALVTEVRVIGNLVVDDAGLSWTVIKSRW